MKNQHLKEFTNRKPLKDYKRLIGKIIYIMNEENLSQNKENMFYQYEGFSNILP